MFTKRNLKLTISAVVIFAASFFAHAGVVDKVIVVVNDEVITQREYDKIFLPIKENYEANFKGDELKRRMEAAQGGLLEQLINSKLIISLAKKEKLTVSDDELKERVDKIKAMYPSETEFLKALNEKGTNLTEFERDIREQILGQKLVEKEVAAKIVVAPAEIRDLYEKNKDKMVAPERLKVRSIMVRKSDNPEENGEKRKKMEGIVAELKKGKPFADLAREKSEGPYANEGGDMGYVTRGQMLEEIDDIIFSLKEGTSSEIIETHVGYHVFLVEEKQASHQLELAEVNDFLRGQLYMKKFEEDMLKWIQEKRKNAYISYK